LARARPLQPLDLKHPLVRLAELIAWERFNAAFGPLYNGTTSRPSNPVRLMVRLSLLLAI